MQKINITSALISAALCIALGSCIKNDIPYPQIQANFLTINAETQTRGSLIDTLDRRVTLYFPETTDLYNVHITDYTLTSGAEIVGESITDGIDLSQPKSVCLRLYQDYQWTINASQDIERYFSVYGQVGSSVIDVQSRRVEAFVAGNIDLKSVLVEKIKIGPLGSVMTPDISGKRVDFSKEVILKVLNHGRDEEWTISVSSSSSSVNTVRADAWTSVAWVYGTAEAGRDNGIEYRLKGDSDWTRVPQQWMTYEGGSFHARIIHLEPLTSYQARAYSDNMYGEVLEFSTGEDVQVPNSDFDSWWLNGKVWNPWAEGGEQFWDSGNKGATTLGPSNCYPTDDTPTGTGQAAQLETRFVGIGPIGKLAAGNIFVGRYVRTDGTNGVLSFGRPFEQRPTKLRGYMKYKTAPVSSATEGFKDMIGRPDTCVIWCALIDSPEPFEIRTNPKNRQLFDSDMPSVIAYGKIQYGETIPEYVPFECQLDYKDTNRVPKYILITASASKYGDYFTGGNGAVLNLDDLELIYDY